MLVVGPLKGGGGLPPEPLRKKKLFFYDLKKAKKTEPHETQENVRTMNKINYLLF